jgi:3-oxoacyl-(acyl-carrier-protein) synthase
MQYPKTLKRVAITGIGCVTPVGIGREQYWEATRAGKERDKGDHPL